MALSKTTFKKTLELCLPLIDKWRHPEVVNALVNLFKTDGLTNADFEAISGGAFLPPDQAKLCLDATREVDSGIKYDLGVDHVS